MTLAPNFWRKKPLGDMTTQEWEALCDGCGKCCLHKLEDDDTGIVSYTNIACRLLDCDTIRCSNYPARQRYVPDCTTLNARNVKKFKWLPESCAYTLLAQGKDLYDWHPLKTGDARSTITSGHSIFGKIIPEVLAGAPEDHVVDDDYFESED
jgi:uncharacterized protein